MQATTRTFYFKFTDSDGKLSNYILLEYQFDEKEHDFLISSHGNAKVSKAYKRTQKSTMDNIKTDARLSKPRVVFDELTEKNGAFTPVKVLELFPEIEMVIHYLRLS